MEVIYDHKDDDGNRVCFYRHAVPRTDSGILVNVSKAGSVIPDDEIPGLISALQNYMSRRATERTHAALRAFPPVTDED